MDVQPKPLSILDLPDEVIVQVFNEVNQTGTLSLVSQRFYEIFNNAFANQLFDNYRAQPFLQNLAQKIDEKHSDLNSIQKVKLLYTTVITSAKNAENGEKIRKDTFQHYGNAISANRLNEILQKIDEEQKAKDFIMFFNVALYKQPGCETFPFNYLDKSSVKNYQEWISHHPNEIAAIQEINISENECLESLPKEIGLFTGLKSLTIRMEQLKRLPPEIGQLKNLEILWIPGNQIESLPLEIGQLDNLKTLNLAGNPLSAWPDGIPKPPKAEIIFGFGE